MHDDVAHLFADFCATGFAHAENLVALLREVFRETSNLSGFSATFGAFEGDENAFGIFGEWHGDRVELFRPVGEEGFEVFEGRALGGAHVVATGGAAESQTGSCAEPEHLAE